MVQPRLPGEIRGQHPRWRGRGPGDAPWTRQVTTNEDDDDDDDYFDDDDDDYFDDDDDDYNGDDDDNDDDDNYEHRTLTYIQVFNRKLRKRPQDNCNCGLDRGGYDPVNSFLVKLIYYT